MRETLLLEFRIAYDDLCGAPDDPLEESTRLLDLGIESLDFIELAMHFEDQYDVELIDAPDLESIQTVGDALDLFGALIARRKEDGDG